MNSNNPMTYKISFNQDDFLVTIKTQGEAKNIQIFLDYLDDLISRDEWESGMNILVDHRQLLTENIDLEGVREIANHFIRLREKLGSGKVAVVMTEDSGFAKAQVFELFAEEKVDMNIKIFVKLKNAEEWIDR